jgi:hypothetical protein
VNGGFLRHSVLIEAPRVDLFSLLKGEHFLKKFPAISR